MNKKEYFVTIEYHDNRTNEDCKKNYEVYLESIVNGGYSYAVEDLETQTEVPTGMEIYSKEIDADEADKIAVDAWWHKYHDDEDFEFLQSTVIPKALKQEQEKEDKKQEGREL